MLIDAIMPDAAVTSDGKASSTESAASTATETDTAVPDYMANHAGCGTTGFKTFTMTATASVYMYMAPMPDAERSMPVARGTMPACDTRPGLAVADYMAMMPWNPHLTTWVVACGPLCGASANQQIVNRIRDLVSAGLPRKSVAPTNC